MDDKVYTVDEIKELFVGIAKKYEIDEAYLFGSYARGDATTESDMDFYIRADKMKSLFILGGLYAEIKNAVKKNIDVITAKATMEKSFEREMKKDLVKIYG
jgi:hypothetical protein